MLKIYTVSVAEALYNNNLLYINYNSFIYKYPPLKTNQVHIIDT